MSLLSENVIPGDHGKIFETNAENQSDLDQIKKAILSIEGVSEVLLDNDIYPREIIVLTTTFVSVEDVAKAADDAGFHILPKPLFHL